jgi:DTW domain-containing protein YfiP
VSVERSAGLAPFHGDGRSSLARCERCALHVSDCMCAEVAPLALATRVVVLAHRREVHKTTGTARLVPLALANAEVRVIGLPEDRVQFDALVAAGTRALVLYPSADAAPLARAHAERGPVTLVVPDGNWRQARKIATKEPALAALEHVRLPAGRPPLCRLRAHDDPAALATFEALARALGVLEGEDVQVALERVLALKVERVLRSRRPSRSGG